MDNLGFPFDLTDMRLVCVKKENLCTNGQSVLVPGPESKAQSSCCDAAPSQSVPSSAWHVLLYCFWFASRDLPQLFFFLSTLTQTISSITIKSWGTTTFSFHWKPWSCNVAWLKMNVAQKVEWLVQITAGGWLKSYPLLFRCCFPGKKHFTIKNCSQWDWRHLAWQQPTIDVWMGEWEPIVKHSKKCIMFSFSGVNLFQLINIDDMVPEEQWNPKSSQLHIWTTGVNNFRLLSNLVSDRILVRHHPAPACVIHLFKV